MDVSTHAQIIEILDSTRELAIATFREDGLSQEGPSG